jgi:hypothetical protein
MDFYCTPQGLLDLVRQFAPIHLDPCPGPAGWTGAVHEFRLDRGENGIDASWAEKTDDCPGFGVAFVNPPYGRGHLDLWAPKIVEEIRKGQEVIALLPANLEVDAWQKHLLPWADTLCFLRGRPKFIDPATMLPTENTGTKGNVVAYFGDRSKAFVRAFSEIGHLAKPLLWATEAP